MSRKIILFFLFCIGLQFGMQSHASAQVRDSIAIYLPPYTDTSCTGSELTFYAVPTSDTFTGATYHWYTNGFFTGVVTDTFFTTALTSGNVVWCVVYFTNSLGHPDSFRSNSIVIYRDSVIDPNVLVYLTAGSNPACSAQPLTFRAYPINGGTNPQYQWYNNGVAIPGEDSVTINQYFITGDVISCRVVSNSPCAPFDTVYSSGINIVQEHYFATLDISVLHDSICDYHADTFLSYLPIPVNIVNYQWYVNGNPIAGGIASTYISDSLNNGDSVYCIMTTTDSCVLNPLVFSNGIKIGVKHVYGNSADYGISAGANPGCLDSPVTFTVQFDSFSTSPTVIWSINGVPVSYSVAFTDTFLNGDTVSVILYHTDNKCYQYDTLTLPSTLMMRDTTPVAPLISLIGDQLVANSIAVYAWYGPTGLIPGVNGSTYHPTDSGYYYAIEIGNGSDIFNCPSDSSNVIFISLLGVNNVLANNLEIYPNPTTGIVELDCNGVKVSLQLDVFNMIGQSLIHDEFIDQAKHELDLSNLSDGVYLVVLKDKSGNSLTRKITIAK